MLDPNASSVSEVMVNLIADLALSLDADTASNLLAGIFDATNNLSDSKVTAETYMAVAQCLRVGGRKPATLGQPVATSQPAQPAYDWSALMPKDNNVPIAEQPVATPQVQEYPTPPVANPIDVGDHTVPMQAATTPAPQSSPEERPYEEGVVSETPEPDWLTPKIFKGTSLG